MLYATCCKTKRLITWPISVIRNKERRKRKKLIFTQDTFQFICKAVHSLAITSFSYVISQDIANKAFLSVSHTVLYNSSIDMASRCFTSQFCPRLLKYSHELNGPLSPISICGYELKLQFDLWLEPLAWYSEQRRKISLGIIKSHLRNSLKVVIFL